MYEKDKMCIEGMRGQFFGDKNDMRKAVLNFELVIDLGLVNIFFKERRISSDRWEKAYANATKDGT